MGGVDVQISFGSAGLAEAARPQGDAVVGPVRFSMSESHRDLVNSVTAHMILKSSFGSQGEMTFEHGGGRYSARLERSFDNRRPPIASFEPGDLGGVTDYLVIETLGDGNSYFKIPLPNGSSPNRPIGAQGTAVLDSQITGRAPSLRPDDLEGVLKAALEYGKDLPYRTKEELRVADQDTGVARRALEETMQRAAKVVDAAWARLPYYAFETGPELLAFNFRFGDSRCLFMIKGTPENPHIDVYTYEQLITATLEIWPAEGRLENAGFEEADFKKLLDGAMVAIRQLPARTSEPPTWR